MIEGKLSRRYAAALFQLASENRAAEEIGAELDRFYMVYVSTPLRTVLVNPAFDIQSRKNIAVQAAQQLQLSPLTIRFLSLLIDRARLAHLNSIIPFYHRLEDEARGRVKAKVIAASSLGPDTVQQLRAAVQKISGKEVLLTEETEPALLGGVVLHLEGTIYDGSVRTQLEKIRKQIEQA
jgi:F-type H+-transporting ATPase subunit delta